MLDERGGDPRPANANHFPPLLQNGQDEGTCNWVVAQFEIAKIKL
jgi:hypothetical protein